MVSDSPNVSSAWGAETWQSVPWGNSVDVVYACRPGFWQVFMVLAGVAIAQMFFTFVDVASNKVLTCILWYLYRYDTNVYTVNLCIYFLYLNWADCIFCKVEYIYQTYSEWWANRDMELTRNQGRLCARDRVHAYYTISMLLNTWEVEFKPNHKIYQSLACCSLQLMASCFTTVFFGVFLEVGFILPSRPRTIPKKNGFQFTIPYWCHPKSWCFEKFGVFLCFFQSWGCQFIHGSPIALHVFF